MESTNAVRSTLENFVEDLHSEVSAHRLEELLRGDDTMTGADVGSKPEPWTRKHLIRPLLKAAELEWEDELHSGGEGYPDFGITNLEVPVIGEDKSINNIEKAEDEIEDYLNNKAASQGAEYGIATDGITWKLVRIELGGDYLDYDVVEPTPIDFHTALLQIARDKGYISPGIADADIDEKTGEFQQTFSRSEFNKLLTEDAPKRIRAKKKAGIEEFYDLYVELLFGEGEGDYEYDTTLLDDIQAPEAASEVDKRKFAIKLVNRLLFVKFLEDSSVLPQNFLKERVDNYEQANTEVNNLGGSLYKSQLAPVFFNLFNTPKDERFSKHRGSWFDKVHYLNGSLFAPDDQEQEYDVDDRMLKQVVTDLVEGHRLEKNSNGNGDGALDPSVLGNVFEMTINHINSGDSQKDEGAYYTPSDVIRHINQESVEPKIYRILVDVYSSRVADGSNMDEDDARSLVQEYGLGEMLKEIEQRNGYFRDPDAIEEAYNRLGDLKIIDPACGSGHFLTGVLDEIHRVRMSLLRGLEGSDLADEDVYQAKKDLVLNTVYGVDVNPIAIEIAKLRVWLKMVEEGWEEGYGPLPNIDINIVAGNSLIGLPAKSGGQMALEAFDLDLSSIQEVRDEYKDGEISRRELNNRIDELRPELQQQYLNRVNHYIEDEVTSVETWSSITDGLDTPYPEIRKITIRRTDGDSLSDDQKAVLEDAGFKVEPRYGKSAKAQDEDINKVNEPGELLEKDYLFELERQPVRHDIEQLENLGQRPDKAALAYEPFHWPVEFPEAATHGSKGYDVEFDIVVGNPPYGDLLGETETRFTSGYKTGGIKDIAAQFLERELHLLSGDAYFGNIITLRLIYDEKAYLSRDVLKEGLSDTRVACFGWRPSYIFAGSEALAAIITGEKNKGSTDDILTSRFVLFSDSDRKKRLENIEYSSSTDLALSECIGGCEVGEPGDKSMPKVGNETAKSTLEKMRDASDTCIRDEILDRETGHVVWRKEGARYWINPLLESFWTEEERSRETKPMYFDSELKQNTVFLLMQSSMFYFHYMAYGDQQHVSWKLVRSFPFPSEEELKQEEQEINRLAEELWSGMEARFDPTAGYNGEFERGRMAELKSVVDEIDELLGPMLGLSEKEVEYVKRLDVEYGRSKKDPDQTVLEDSIAAE